MTSGHRGLDADSGGTPPTVTRGRPGRSFVPTGPFWPVRPSRQSPGSGWQAGACCGSWSRSLCCSRPAAARSHSSARPVTGRRHCRRAMRRRWRRVPRRRRPIPRPRSRRACRHPPPRSASRPRRPPPPGPSPSVVSVAPAVKSASAPVEIVLSHYFQGINDHNYAEYASSQTAQGKVDQPRASFDSGYATTADSGMTLTSLTPTGDGDLTATVTVHQSSVAFRQRRRQRL